MLIRAGQHAESESSARAAIALAPGDAAYHFLLCQALANQHRPADAIKAARHAADLAPTNPEYRKKLSELLLLLGAVDEAEAELRVATGLIPGDPALRMQLDELVAWKAALATHQRRLSGPGHDLTAPRSAGAAKAKVAACVIVKNEAESILEWMAFHACLGFDTLIVVDDGSTDGTPDIVARMGRDRDVRLSRYSEERDRQAKAYQKICTQYRHEFDWIAFIDADEFIVPTQGDDIHELTDRAGDHSALALPWLMFGSSGHVEKPRQPIVEAFRHRAPDQFGPNRHVKSIVRPARVIAGINAHCFAVDGTYCGPDGGPLLWQEPGILRICPPLNDWRVQHYFTRSMAHWQERMRRGQLSRLKRTMDMFFEYDRNEVLDETALRFLPSVRRVLETYQQHDD